MPMHNVISYADHAIKCFFDKVKDKPWFNNTIFVFSADHTGLYYREEYNNEMGKFLIPIFFYTPGGQLPVRCDSTRLMQQADITPSVLHLLNYRKPYFSFGKDVFSQDSTFVNYVFNDWNGTSMYYLDSLMIEYHGNQLTGIYDFRHDFSLKSNLLERRGGAGAAADAGRRIPPGARLSRGTSDCISWCRTRADRNWCPRSCSSG